MLFKNTSKKEACPYAPLDEALGDLDQDKL